VVRRAGDAALARGELFAARDMDAPEERRIAAGQVCLVSRRGPRKRKPNEDAALVISAPGGRAVLAVADGVGSHPRAGHAARLALLHLARAVRRAGGGRMALPAAILSGIEAAQAALLRLGAGAASTLALAELHGRRLRTYHAGDSGALIVGPGAAPGSRTVDHSPLGYARAAGLIGEREALRHPDRNLISNALGVEPLRVEVGLWRALGPRDTLLVASDGLLGTLSTREIARELAGRPLPAGVARLADAARERMQASARPDDLTIAAFRPRAAGPGASSRAAGG
jgi:serine/threonine protein phosphatase PrpC